MNRICASLLILANLASVSAVAATAASSDDARLLTRVEKVLAKTPLIDGHNDLPWEIRDRGGKVDLAIDNRTLPPSTERSLLMTDVVRLREGHVGGQFWSVWIPPTTTGPEAVKTTLEQIDVVRRMVEKYPRDLEMAYTADDIVRIQKAGRVASLIGIEGGHQIDNSLPVLRQMYVLGVRYMTLTHSRNTDWADAATEDPKHNGLTGFGREVIAEMNRLGMLIDLSHVSEKTMKDALEITKAPVVYSHSDTRALNDHPRNVSDDVLKLLAKNRGVLMVNFYPGYVSAQRAHWDADRAAEKTRYNSPPLFGLYIGQPERAAAALAEWDRQHPKPTVTIAMVADHIEHVRDVASVDNVGLGSDFDGIPDTPDGLDGVDKYPALLVELARRGWADADLAKLAGGNTLRVMREAEAVAKRLQAERPSSQARIEDYPDTLKK
ncbi:MAG: dipeptidase [Dokdonella sp.]